MSSVLYWPVVSNTSDRSKSGKCWEIKVGTIFCFLFHIKRNSRYHTTDTGFRDKVLAALHHWARHAYTVGELRRDLEAFSTSRTESTFLEFTIRK